MSKLPGKAMLQVVGMGRTKENRQTVIDGCPSFPSFVAAELEYIQVYSDRFH